MSEKNLKASTGQIERILPTASEREQFSAIVAKAKVHPVYDMSPDPEQLRREFLAFADTPLARRVPSSVAMSQSDDGTVAGSWFTPHRNSGKACILYLHGGGFVGGSVAGARGIAGSLSAAFEVPVFAVAYSQAPEHPFPAAPDDALKAYSKLVREMKVPIIIVGDSAGAALAFGAALDATETNLPRPQAVISASGIFDFRRTTPSWRLNAKHDIVSPDIADFFYGAYLGGAGFDQPRASPLNRDLSPLPPVLMQVGGHEVMRDDSLLLASKARAKGVQVKVELYEEMPHNFIKFASSISDKALERMVQWWRKLSV